LADSPTIFVPRKYFSMRDILKSLEDKGATYGRSKGAYVAGDLSELKTAILLCGLCKHGFDWKKHHYYNTTHYDHVRARGRCDICREERADLSLYLHESVIGQSWTPRVNSMGPKPPTMRLVRKGVRHG